MDTDKEKALQTIKEGKILSVSTSLGIYFKNMRLVNPALDANPNHNLILTVPFPGVRRVKAGKDEWKDKADIALMCITDSMKLEDRFFEATDENFLSKGWLARVPSPDLDPRWSMESISEYLYGDPRNVTPAQCYAVVLEQFNYFLDFGKESNAAEVCSAYVLLSYIYFVFEYICYLKFGGEKESGKSKAGSIFENLAFNGKVTLNETVSSMFRFVQDNRGCLIIDEAEQLHFKDDKLQAYYQILNGGFQKTGSVTRTNNDTLRPERYSVYGPKVICAIFPLMEVLETRTLEIIMLKTKEEEKGNREVVRDDPRWQPIRDLLYLCLLEHWKDVRELQKVIQNDYGFQNRFWNLAKPLLVIAKWIDSYDASQKAEEKIRVFLRNQIKAKASRNVSSLTTSILAACRMVLSKENKDGHHKNEYQFRIKLSDVTDNVREIEGDTKDADGKFKIQPKRVTGILSNLRLYTDPIREGKGFTFLLSMAEIEDIESRFTNEPNEQNERVNDKSGGHTSGGERSSMNEGVPNSTFTRSFPSSSSLVRGTLEREGVEYASCKEHPDGWFTTEQWEVHVRAYHAESV